MLGEWTTPKMITEIYDRNTYGEPVARYRKKPLPRREIDGDGELTVANPTN
jgi:hypothetical protein